MHIETNKAFLFYPLLIVCISIDFFTYFWVGMPCIFSLLAFSSVALSHDISILRLCAILAALALESFLLYGQWGVQLIYLVPLAFIARYTWDMFSSATHHALMILLSGLLVQLVIIDSQIGIKLLSIFTLIKILINILLTISISLTYI